MFYENEWYTGNLTLRLNRKDAIEIMGTPVFVIATVYNRYDAFQEDVNRKESVERRGEPNVTLNPVGRYALLPETLVVNSPSPIPQRSISPAYSALTFYGLEYIYLMPRYGLVHEEYQYIQLCKPFDVAPPPPPKIPPPKEDCCMCNDDLLRLINKKLGDYPGVLPASVKNSVAGTTTINSVAEHLIHNYKTFDEVVGSFPVVIRIEDTDLIQDGEQTKTVEIQNIAQGIAEIFGSNILSKADTAAILAVCLSTLTETSQTKQIATKNYDILKSILDWLGFKFKEVSRKIVLMVKPGENRISDMVQPSEVDYITVEEDFGKSNFQLFINNMSDFAAHWFAANRVSLGKRNVEENLQSLKSQFVGAKEIDKAINTDLKDHLKPATSDSDFDNFLEQAEKGFETLPDITPDQGGSISPWGKPFNKRPKLTQKSRTNEGSSNL